MTTRLRALLLLAVACPTFVSAQQPITLKDVPEGLPVISADEPMAAEFSAEKAAQYLDRSALNWVKTKKCVTCHTNLFYMVARPALRTILPDSGEVRSFYEDYRKVRWQKNGPTEAAGFWPIVVGTGLTFNDVQATGKHSDVARDVLDMMWKVQREDGGWNWPHCDYAPMEIDDHYGVTIAALTVGVAPGGYAKTSQSLAGLESIATEEQRQQTLTELLALQLDDGGWSTAGFLTDWKGLARGDGKPLNTKTSDGYGTGLVMVIAREHGVPADDARLRRGVKWIHANQRESGKWFTQSPVNDAGNLISNVGSAYVILALQACGELPGWPFSAAKPATISALKAAPPNTTGETDHFWYRLAPEGPYIDSQRDHRAFGFGEGRIFLSEDNCRTWAHSAAFPDAENITFSCFLKNGNILFATREKLFLSTDNLKTHRPITVKDRGGRDYLPHTPVNPDEPGWYFHPLDGEHTWDVKGTEMLVWGNYCNVTGGPVPVNIYYSTDNGQTVKIAYSFGQNPHFQQKGAAPGTLLGDATNPLITRHIHGLVYNPNENAFYTCTGDIDRGHGNECHWLRGTYDAQADTWDWMVLVSVNSDSRFKSGGMNFVGGRLYWVADANGPKLGPRHDRGVFTCAPEDIANKAAHKLLFNLEFESANMIVQDGVMLAALYAPASTSACGFVYSPDMGKTWSQYDLKEFGPRSGCRFHKKNSDGWFRVDLRKGWIDRAEVLFIKPKP